MSNKPIALDLFCGKGGWSLGLLAAGWDVIGIDIEDMGGYPAEAKLILADVLKVSGKDFPGVSLVVASPPCQEYSYRSFPFKRCRWLAENVPPNRDLWHAAERIARECNAPLIIENVRGAQRYHGKAVTHYGSFYLWGDVPAMLPIGRPVKGFQMVDESNRATRGPLNAERIKKAGGKCFAGECERVDPVRFKDHAAAQVSSKSLSRKEWSARAAMIPPELSRWIGQCFYPRAEVVKRADKIAKEREG